MVLLGQLFDHLVVPFLDKFDSLLEDEQFHVFDQSVVCSLDLGDLLG